MPTAPAAASLRLAVVGSGPAGLGVLTGLLDSAPGAHITLFDIDRPLERPRFTGTPDPDHVAAYYDDLYAEIWKQMPRRFPPPKTHFAQGLPRFAVGGKGRLFKSDTLGGLSNFWGGTALPFTDAELGDWPIGYPALDPHYQRIADLVGIAGREDALNRYFRHDYVNRPAMHVTAAFAKMERSINEAAERGAFEVIAGVNRCMLETRPEQANSCIRCGECMAGCVRESIFNAGSVVQRLLAEHRVVLTRGEVSRFDPRLRTIELSRGATRETVGPFDRIYLAAGCPNTTAITLRSLGLRDSDPMSDNAVYVFPVFYFGSSVTPGGSEPYLSLTNLLVGLIPRATSLPFAQVQLYANNDYMWRYNLPPSTWRFFRGVVEASRSRLFWGRLYLHGRLSQSYSVSLDGDAVRFDYARRADTSVLADMMPPLRRALNRGGFYAPPIPPIQQNTNSHYASTFPMKGARLPVGDDGSLVPGVFLCDSTIFPSQPAVSPTFTIMANARRVALASL